MTKSFDKFLEWLDNAAEEHVDGRKYSPRRDYIKEELSNLIHNVGTDAGQEFTDKIIEHLEDDHVPREGRIRWIAEQIREEHSKPAGDQGPYSLHRD